MLKELGANHIGGGEYGFLVWAPLKERIDLVIHSQKPRRVGMKKRSDGFFEAIESGLAPGDCYMYSIDGDTERPDPASRHQPDGVHSASALIDCNDFRWTDAGWKGILLEDYIIYELHIGTFTPEGTFDAATGRIPYLKELGVTAVEVMPVAQFPGSRNWGYDGVYPYAVQQSYGGPEGFKRFVDRCHANGLAVLMDVVYNHLGPEGNYLHEFGPYFTDKYVTPWGWAVNFDGPYSDGVRRYFVENAIYWLEKFHVDALRIDAVHGIFDFSAKHILREIKEAVEATFTDRLVYVTAESDLNDVRLIAPASEGGYGLDAQWNDDFHHCLHTLLSGESNGYYVDFGSIGQMAKAVREGFVYSGQYSKYRKRRHGSSTAKRPPGQFVIFSQNHDQVGNRAYGDRPSEHLSIEKLKLAACMVLLSPGIPLLFMGEEYGETAPFQYFVSHGDSALVEAVREGRLREFSAFGWDAVPDPQDAETFERSKIDVGLRTEGRHRELFEFYREIISLKKRLRYVFDVTRQTMEVVEFEDENVIAVRLNGAFTAANFSGSEVELKIPFGGSWREAFRAGNPGRAGRLSGNIQSFIRLSPYDFSLFTEEA